MTRKVRRKRSKAVSASDLAQMGVCERLVLFEDRYGTRSTASQRAAMQRGLTEHERFYLDGVLLSEKKAPCYIATLVFGPSRETAALKLLRDRVLRPHPTGRWLIGLYYRTAPRVCEVLERWPWLQPVVRALLKPIAWIVERALRFDGREHVT
jgi:hypothetical protein